MASHSVPADFLQRRSHTLTHLGLNAHKQAIRTQVRDCLLRRPVPKTTVGVVPDVGGPYYETLLALRLPNGLYRIELEGYPPATCGKFVYHRPERGGRTEIVAIRWYLPYSA